MYWAISYRFWELNFLLFVKDLRNFPLKHARTKQQNIVHSRQSTLFCLLCLIYCQLNIGRQECAQLSVPNSDPAALSPELADLSTDPADLANSSIGTEHFQIYWELIYTNGDLLRPNPPSPLPRKKTKKLKVNCAKRWAGLSCTLSLRTSKFEGVAWSWSRTGSYKFKTELFNIKSHLTISAYKLSLKIPV